MSRVLALLGARYKSLWRLLWGKGGVMPVIGLLIGVSILALVMLGCAWVMAAWTGPELGRIRIAALIITGLHLFTLIGAGMGGRLGIFNDPRPLLPYPLSRFDWALAASLGQALDFGTGYALAGTIGLALGLGLFGGGGAALLAIPILLIGHLVLAVQVAGLSGIAARLSRSRRFRDGMQLFGVLLSVGMTALYFWFIFPRSGARAEFTGLGTLSGLLEPAGYLSFSGALLKTLAALRGGETVVAALGGAATLLHLLLAFGLIAAAVHLAQRETGRGGGGIVRSRALAFLLRPLPWSLAAFLAKDLSYLRREPGLAGRLGGSLLNSLLLIVFVALVRIPFSGFYYFLMAMSAHGAARMIFYNQWGYEGPGIRFLLASGADPMQMLISKWLLGFTVIAIDAGLKALVLWWLLPGSASHWLLYGMILALAPVGAALGGYISLRQPWPMLGRGRLRNRQQLFDWAMVPIMMAMRLIFLFSALPVLLLWWLMKGNAALMNYAPLALLCAIGYALALSVAALPFLAKQFELRRPELMEALSLPEESI